MNTVHVGVLGPAVLGLFLGFACVFENLSYRGQFACIVVTLFFFV